MQYARLKHDQDRADATYLAMYSRITQICSQLSGKLAFMKPELTAIDSKILDGFFKRIQNFKCTKSFSKILQEIKLIL